MLLIIFDFSKAYVVAIKTWQDYLVTAHLLAILG